MKSSTSSSTPTLLEQIARSFRFTSLVSSSVEANFDSLEEHFPLDYTTLIHICDSLLLGFYNQNKNLSSNYKAEREKEFNLLKNTTQPDLLLKGDKDKAEEDIKYIMDTPAMLSSLKRDEEEKDKEFSFEEVMLEYIFSKREHYISKKEEIIKISALPSKEAQEGAINALTEAYVKDNILEDREFKKITKAKFIRDNDVVKNAFKTKKEERLQKLKKLEEARRLNLPLFDVEDAFDTQAEINRWFPLELVSGHLSSNNIGSLLTEEQVKALIKARDLHTKNKIEERIKQEFNKKRLEYKAALLIVSSKSGDETDKQALEEKLNALNEINESQAKSEKEEAKKIQLEQGKEGEPLIHPMVEKGFIAENERVHFPDGSLDTLSRFLDSEGFSEGPVSRLMRELFIIAREETATGRGELRGLAAFGSLPHNIITDIVIPQEKNKTLIERIKNKTIIFADLALLSEERIKECINKGTSPYYMAIREGDTALQNEVRAHHEDDLEQINEMLLEDCMKEDNITLYKELLEKKPNLVKYINENSHLHSATQNNSTKIIEFLLEIGVNIEAIDRIGDTPLITALRKNNMDAVKLLLSEGANVEASDKDGNTPLLLALKTNNMDAVKLLLNKGADIGKKDGDGSTPLMLAIRKNNIDTTELLLKEGANIEEKDKNGDTPLLYALRVDTMDVAKLLLNKGANFEARDGNNNTPIFWAISRNDTDLVKLLLDKGASLKIENIYDKTPLHLALSQNNTDILKLLLEKWTNIEEGDKNKNTPLLLAVKENNTDAIKLLLDKGANVEGADNYRETPLIWALKKNNTNAIKLLLDKGANIEATNRDGDTPLLWALRENNIDVVKLLLEKKANIEAVDNYGNTPLLWALKNNKTEAMELLLDKGASIKAIGNHGYTSLHWASIHNNEYAIELLLNKGANIEAADKSGCTPLSVASQSNSTETVKLLLGKGANIEASDEDGCTPLIWASMYNNLNIIKLLLDEGANIEASDKNGNTPLFYASEGQNRRAMELLLDKGANIEALNDLGDRFLHWVLQGNNIKIVEFLLNKGANIEALNENDRTPLFVALQRDNMDVVKLLLNRGANLNITGDGHTPLSLAMVSGNGETIRLLIEHGAVLSRDDILMYPLSSAKTYLHSLFQKAGEYISESVFPSSSVQLLSDRDIQNLNKGSSASHTEREEMRRSDTGQNTQTSRSPK